MKEVRFGGPHRRAITERNATPVGYDLHFPSSRIRPGAKSPTRFGTGWSGLLRREGLTYRIPYSTGGLSTVEVGNRPNRQVNAEVRRFGVAAVAGARAREFGVHHSPAPRRERHPRPQDRSPQRWRPPRTGLPSHRVPPWRNRTQASWCHGRPNAAGDQLSSSYFLMARGSPNTVEPSSKAIPCLRRFDSAFGRSHSKMYPMLLPGHPGAVSHGVNMEEPGPRLS